MFQEIVDLLRGEILEEVKSEINAATIKHMACLIYLARHQTGPTGDEELEHAADLALKIDAAVEHRLEEG